GRAVASGAGGGGAAGGHPLYPHTDHAAAAAVAARGVLAADLAFESEPPVDQRPAGGQSGAAGGAAHLRLFRPRVGPADGGGEPAAGGGDPERVEPAGGGADGDGDGKRVL